MKKVPGPDKKEIPDSLGEFRRALSGDQPPAGWGAPLRALWWDANGDWEAAHEIAQELPTSWGAWMHAYLHRKEGDLWNAGYWYRKARKPEAKGPLEPEFNDLLQAVLDADRNAV